jgi:hypothetical protein
LEEVAALYMEPPFLHDADDIDGAGSFSLDPSIHRRIRNEPHLNAPINCSMLRRYRC